MEEQFFIRLLNKVGNQSIFKDENKLEDNFIPPKLPHREKELSLLYQLFLPLFSNQNVLLKNFLILGNSGVGKTVTIKLFGEALKNASKARKIPFYFAFINCRIEKSGYRVLMKIIKSIKNDFPKRGYSPADLLEILNEFVKINNGYLLIVLDELNYLIKNDKELLYSLTRLNDDFFNTCPHPRYSIIGILRDISYINTLDSGTMSTLQKNIIRFIDYSREQIFDILKYRAEISLRKNTISDNLIRLISDTAFTKRDIRYGLNLLWEASIIAERKNLSVITEECVEFGNQEIFPIQSQNKLADMSTQKLLFLFSVIISLIKSNKSFIPFIETFKPFYSICEEIGVKSSSHSQLWDYLQEYKNKKFLTVKAHSKNNQGRKGLIGVKNIPLIPFEQDIKILLASRGLFV